MNLIAIETSSENISFSAMRDGRIVSDFNHRLPFGASKIVFYIEKQLKQASPSFDNIDAFVIGSGPGSFTGLRISFAVIKAFALALQKPVIAINSFYSVAYPFIARHKRIAVISDARRELVYAGSFIVKNGMLHSEGHPKLEKFEEFVKIKKDYFFITYDSSLRQKVCEQYPYVNFYRGMSFPCAKHLCFVAKDYYNKKRFTSLEKLEPLYLYPKTCQIRNSYKP